MSIIEMEPIGYVKSPYGVKDEVPFQGTLAPEVTATIRLEKKYLDGLKGLGNCSHIVVIFYFHKAGYIHLQTVTPWGPEVKGIFATRSPHRPNHIGMTTVKLVHIEGCDLTIQGPDMMDGTPVLDIKPYSSKLEPDSVRESIFPPQNS